VSIRVHSRFRSLLGSGYAGLNIEQTTTAVSLNLRIAWLKIDSRFDTFKSGKAVYAVACGLLFNEFILPHSGKKYFLSVISPLDSMEQ